MQASRRARVVSALGTALVALTACSSDVTKREASDQADATIVVDGGAGGTTYDRLDCGTQETLVDGIKSAENMLFTSTGRLFVSGDDGIVELVRNGAHLEASSVTTDPPCGFLGLVESKGMLYANCYTGTSGKLYAAVLQDSVSFEAIFDFPESTLPNGLSADERGRLYASSSFGKAILVLDLAADGRSVATSQTWVMADDLTLPNGVKVHDGALYWVNQGQVRKTRIESDGKAGASEVLIDQVVIFDDLSVSDAGILVADLTGGALAAFDLTGVPIGRTPMKLLDTPSSVLPALGRLGFANDDLIVTEKNANRVAAVHLCARGIN